MRPRGLRAWCHALPRMRASSLPASPLPVCSRMGRASRPRRASPGVIGALGRGRERGNAVKGNVEYRSRAAARICRESPLTEWSANTCPRGKRPPVSLCPTASAGVGAEGAAPPTRDWFLGMPPGRPFFPKRAKRVGEPVPPPVGATPRARRVATRRAARPSVRSALRRSTRLYAVKGSVLPYLSKGGIV